MTDSLESRLRQSFARAALDAPSAEGVAAAARARAVRRRRRVAVAGSLSVATVLFLGAWMPHLITDGSSPHQVASSPVDDGPLTATECPRGVNGGGPPLYVEGEAVGGSPNQQVQAFAAQVVLPDHPTAQLHQGENSPDRRTYVYQLPDGNRVAVITYQLTDRGWEMASEQHC